MGARRQRAEVAVAEEVVAVVAVAVVSVVVVVVAVAVAAAVVVALQAEMSSGRQSRAPWPLRCVKMAHASTVSCNQRATRRDKRETKTREIVVDLMLFFYARALQTHTDTETREMVSVFLFFSCRVLFALTLTHARAHTTSLVARMM